MSLAPNALYRNVRVAWSNHDAAGSETVQLFAKIAGGAWTPVAIFAEHGDDQSGQWATALPVAAYDVAMRYLNGNVPAVGYESTDPDAWTAASAPLSKASFETTSADVAWGAAPSFVNAATPITLTWSSEQLAAPYLLEKNAGAGWVTVAADLVATSYQYTIPGGEVGLTVTFRLTAQRGAVVGPTAGTMDVPMFITVGQPTITTHTFDENTATVSLAWSAASGALQYLIEKSDDAGAHWSTVATVAGLSYDYVITPTEANTDVKFRVTGQNGGVSGTASAVVTVTCTMTAGPSTVTGLSAAPFDLGFTKTTFSATYTSSAPPATGRQVEWTGLFSQVDNGGDTADSTVQSIAYPPHGSVTVRVRSFAPGPVYGPWSTPFTVVF